MQQSVAITGLGVVSPIGLDVASVAASLREMNYSGRIILAAEEPHLPYHRPPLSKALKSIPCDFSTDFTRKA